MNARGEASHVCGLARTVSHAGKCIKFLWDGELVTQKLPQRTGTFPRKRCQVATPEILESESDTVRVWKTPTGSQNEQAL